MAFRPIPNFKMESRVTNYLNSDSDDQLQPRKIVNFEANREFEISLNQFDAPICQEDFSLDIIKKDGVFLPAENLPNEISFIEYDADQINQRDHLNESPIFCENFNDIHRIVQNAPSREAPQYQYCADSEMKEEHCADALLKLENNMDIECDNTSNFESTLSTQITPVALNQNFFMAVDPVKSSKLDYTVKSEFEEDYSYGYDEISNDPTGYQQVENKIRKNLPKVSELVERVLQGRKVENSQLQNLGDFERSIIVSLNQKKSKSEGIKISKRREEKQKLFFKAALKQVENNYLINILKCRSTLRKKEADVNAFYNAYFADVAEERGVDISTFYPPCQKRRFRPEGSEHLKNEIKSFNLRYIELILCSKKFREDTRDFLENEFSQSYSKTRFKKIDKLLENAMNVLSQSYKQSVLANNLRSADIIQLAIGRFQELIINNPKSKLPWSDYELEETKAFARQTIDKICQSLNNQISESCV